MSGRDKTNFRINLDLVALEVLVSVSHYKDTLEDPPYANIVSTTELTLLAVLIPTLS